MKTAGPPALKHPACHAWLAPNATLSGEITRYKLNTVATCSDRANRRSESGAGTNGTDPGRGPKALLVAAIYGVWLDTVRSVDCSTSRMWKKIRMVGTLAEDKIKSQHGSRGGQIRIGIGYTELNFTLSPLLEA